ncbi:ATP-binding protein [Rhizobium sp. F40D2]|uniref:sensor histidine kinase n=1 Tax=Rhizobium sp. F40D2 TaxID=3453141 RepID=UPI003F25567B
MRRSEARTAHVEPSCQRRRTRIPGRSDNNHRPFEGAGFELSVANTGAPIPADAIERLFLPFTRVADDGKQGLGLGLYIASEIAKAHGGRLRVASDETRTVFTLEIPA